MDPSIFFPPGERVLAFPGWSAPRLLMAADTGVATRWRDSALYPAFRMRARLFRTILRAGAALGAGMSRRVPSGRWLLGDFARDVIGQPGTVVVLDGTPGPGRKTTIQIRSRSGQVLGYIKFAQPPQARQRLERERKMLAIVPSDLGPQVMKFGNLADGLALLITPIEGRAAKVGFPPTEELVDFALSLRISEPLDLTAHPWVNAIRGELGTQLDRAFEVLAPRLWPIAIQHGDLAPWNLRVAPDGTVRAFDWENGSADGFPYVDLVQYGLQLGALLYRWRPTDATDRIERWLARDPRLDLTSQQARALVLVGAADAFSRSRIDGHADHEYLQRWRRAVWQGE